MLVVGPGEESERKGEPGSRPIYSRVVGYFAPLVLAKRGGYDMGYSSSRWRLGHPTVLLLVVWLGRHPMIHVEAPLTRTWISLGKNYAVVGVVGEAAVLGKRSGR